MRTAIAPVLLALALGAPVPGWAQSTTDLALSDGFTPGAMMPGSPMGSYALSGFDTVNVSTGYVNIALPLLTISARGATQVPLLATLSPIWTAYEFSYQIGSCSPTCHYATGYTAGFEVGSTNGLGLGAMSFRSSGDVCQVPTGENPNVYGTWENMLTRATFYAPNGTQTDFLDQNSGGDPKSGTAGYNRGTVFNATDGSFAKFTSSTSISDPVSSGNGCYSSEFNATGTLQLRDGTTYTISNGVVTQIRDRNGNLTALSGNPGSAVITDSLGRTYTEVSGYDSNSQRYYEQIQYKGYNAAQRTITIWYESLSQVLKSGESIETYGQLWPELSNVSGSDFQESFDPPEMVSEIDLADGSKYTFAYHNYGDVAQIILPTGGEVQYDYTASTGLSTPPALQRVLSQRREYLQAGNTSPSAVTNYSLSGSSATISHLDGSKQVYSVLNTGSLPSGYTATGTGYNSWQYNLPETITYYDTDGATVLETQTESWAQQNCSSCWFGSTQSSTAPLYDPYMGTITTAKNGLSQQTSYGYDADNDVTDAYVYDWTTSGTGTLLRHTQTIYYYPGTSIVALPTEIKIFNGGGTLYSDTKYTYDIANVLPESNITYHDNTNFGGNGVRGNVSEISQCLNASNCTWLNTNLVYDVAGNLMSRTDANNHTTYLYYSDNYSDGQNRNTYGFLTTAVNALGQAPFQAQYDYNTGKPTITVDINNLYTFNSYNDPLERLTQVHLPNGGYINYSYLSAYQVFKEQDQNTPGDNVLQSMRQYDGFGRPMEADTFETPWSQYIATTTAYDALGRVQTTRNPTRWTNGTGDGLGYATTYSYDGLGRIKSVTTADGAATTTSYWQNYTTITDPAGKVRVTATDGLGRTTAVWEDPNGYNYQTSYLYDPLDDLTEVIQSGQTRDFGYDSLGRMTSATNPESGTVTYTYDGVGNVKTRTDARNITSSYSYDAVNRPITISYNDNKTYTTTLGYDAAGVTNSKGHLTSIFNYTASMSFGPFSNGEQPTASSEVTGGGTYNFSYGYNLAGALTSETYPSGRAINTSYDTVNRVSGVSGSGTQYVSVESYWPHGVPLKYTYGNQVTRTYGGFTPQLQVNQFWDAQYDNGNYFLFIAQPVDWGSTHDNGTLQDVAWWESSNPGIGQVKYVQNFTYDSLNRLSSASDTGGWSRSYGYDAWGNAWVTANSGLGYSPATPIWDVYGSNNRISTSSYDNAGNILALPPGYTFAYDAENRQTSETNSGGLSANYYYDGIGDRVEKVLSNGQATVYVYDAFGNLAEEWSPYNAWSKDYVWFNGQVAATQNASSSPCATCYFSYDHLGSVRMVTDQNANVVARHDFVPFGEEIPAGTAGRNGQYGAFDSTSQRFTGQIRDTETILDFFNARYYLGGLARFNSPDPANAGAVLTDPQTWNGYAYVRNNPLNATDPSGLAPILYVVGPVGTGDIFDYSFQTVMSTAVNSQMFGISYPPQITTYFSPGGSYFGGVTGGGGIGGGGGGRGGGVTQAQQPPKSGTPAPNNGEPPSACLIANINAVNAVSNLNVNLSNVVGQPFIFNGGLDVNFSVPGASPSQLPAGRYASSVLTQILGIGHSLHVPGPGGTDPSTYGVDPTTGNFTFTTHIDTGYSTWHTPIGAIIHYFTDVRDKGAHRGPC